MTTTAVVWFKRDLRLYDHTPLAAAQAFERSLALYVIQPDWLRSPECDPRHSTWPRAEAVRVRTRHWHRFLAPCSPGHRARHCRHARPQPGLRPERLLRRACAGTGTSCKSSKTSRPSGGHAKPVVNERVALAEAKQRLYGLRQAADVRAEAQTIQNRHGSRKSGLPRPTAAPAAATRVKASSPSEGQGELF